VTGHRTVRIVCVGLLLVAVASITGGTSARSAGDVTITITQDATPVASNGTDGDFNVVVTATNNTGADLSAETLDLTLNLPSGVALTGSSTGLSLSSLPTDTTPTVVATIPAHAGPSASPASGLTGTGTISGGTPATVGNYDIAVDQVADLGIAWSGLPTTNQVAGLDSFNATATVTNYGPSDSATGWSATLTVPTGFAFTSATGCTISGDKLTASCPSSGVNLDPTGSSTKAFPVSVSVLHNAAAGSASIGASVTPDPSVPEGSDTHPDSNPGSVPVVVQADLGVAWSGLPTTSQVAGQASFTPTATVTNTGPSDSGGGWSAKLTLPTGFAFHAAPSGCTLSVANTIATCPGQNLDPSSSSTDHRDFSATVDVLHNAPVGDDGVEAKVTPGIDEGTDTAPDDVVKTVPVIAIADLGVALTGVPTANQIAGQDSFPATLNVTNHGPSDSGAGWSASLTIPSGLALDTSVALPGACSQAAAVVTCNGSNIDPTAVTPTVQFPIQVKVLHDATVGDHTLNAAVAPSLPEGANTATNTTSAPVHVIARADLALSVSTTPGSGASPPYVAGDGTKGAFSYVYTVTNNGPSDHNGDFTVTDTLPAGFVFQSGAGCGAVGQVVTCTDSSVLDPTSPTGKSHVFTVGVKVDHTVADNSYSDNASVATGSTATPEPDNPPNNNSASTSVSVITKADLVITGTGDGASRSPALIFANGTLSENTVTFTVTFHNGGPSDARHSTLKFNSLSSHLGGADWCLVTGSVACGPSDTFTTYSDATGVDVGTLAPGDSATVVLRAHALSTDRNGPFNVAQGFAVSLPLPTTDDTPSNNTTTAPSVEIDTVSSPPQNVQAVPGNGNAIVTWQEPSNLGGPTRTIIDYSVTVTPSVPLSPFTVSAGATKVACPNLTTNDCYQLNVSGLAVTKPATTYVFAVTARNQVGSSDSASASAKPSANAAAALVPAAGSTLSTCTVATTAQPVCVSFTVPGGGSGGVFGTLGGFPDVILPGGFCGAGATCNTPSASSGIGPLSAYLNRKNPIKETILWDSSTIPASALKANSCGANKTIITCFPNNVTFYDESSTALAANQPSEPMNAPGHIHFCADSPRKGGAGNVNWARSTPYTDSAGSACIQSMTVQTGQPGRDAQKGDVQVVLLFTSDSDIIQGHR
jgi:hypothetical protein